jgi:hypothetical protein
LTMAENYSSSRTLRISAYSSSFSGRSVWY